MREFYEACGHGDLNKVKLMIKSYQSGLNKCKRSIYDSFCVNYEHINWNIGLFLACKRGDSEMVSLMIKYGADDFLKGFVEACYSNNIYLILHMMSLYRINNYANILPPHILREGLANACSVGSLPTVLCIIDQGIDEYGFLDINFSNACAGDHLHIVQFLIHRHMLTGNLNLWKNGFIRACGHGSLEVVEYLISQDKRIIHTRAIDSGVLDAVKNGHLNIIKYLIKKLPPTYVYVNARNVLINATKNNHLDIIVYLLEHGHGWIIVLSSIYCSMLYISLELSNIPIIRYLISLGTYVKILLFKNVYNDPILFQKLAIVLNEMKFHSLLLNRIHNQKIPAELQRLIFQYI